MIAMMRLAAVLALAASFAPSFSWAAQKRVVRRPVRPATKPQSTISFAPKRNGAYELLESKALKIDRQNNLNGWGYIVSGSIVTAISIPGYYLSKDVFAQVVYSIGQTVGIGAITYGTSLVLVDNDYLSFYNILKSDPTLPQEHKEALAEAYLMETAHKARQGRKIRFVFHSLTAGLNFLNAVTATNSDLSAALYFLGGINTLAAVHYLFSETEEEKIAQSLHTEPTQKVSFEPMIGPIVGLQVHW